MMKYIQHHLLKRQIKNSRGSATLEATLILPVIMLLLFSMISLGLFLYYKFVILNSALYAVEQSTMTWNSSKKNLETGAIENTVNPESPENPENQKTEADGLYWRVTKDFSNAPLVSQKKNKALIFFETLVGKPVFAESEKSNQVAYNNHIISRQVSIETERKLLIRDIFVSKAAEGAGASVASEVVEPIEFIRNYELGSDYLNQLLEYLAAGGQPGQDEEAELSVYASKNSNVNGQKLYHFSGCRYINQIKKENLIVFASESEAQQEGFHICLICAKNKKD